MSALHVCLICQEDKARIKSKIVAKMLKGTLSAAFATWAQHTVEQNEGVRQKLTVDEALAEKDRMLDEFRELVAEMCAKEGEWFNDDNHYKDAMTWSLDTKRGIIRIYIGARMYMNIYIYIYI